MGPSCAGSAFAREPLAPLTLWQEQEGPPPWASSSQREALPTICPFSRTPPLCCPSKLPPQLPLQQHHPHPKPPRGACPPLRTPSSLALLGPAEGHSRGLPTALGDKDQDWPCYYWLTAVGMSPHPDPTLGAPAPKAGRAAEHPHSGPKT